MNKPVRPIANNVDTYMIDVLLIDDDEDEYFIFSDAITLMEEPVCCSYANSAEKALDILQSASPKLILVDMNMPMTNGIECIRKICAIKREHLPLLVLYSTNIDERTCREARMAGAAHCLQKTTSLDMLVEKLSPLLSRAS